MITLSWTSVAITRDASGEASAGATDHVLSFDAVLKETHNSQSDITEHAVERGAALADHKRPRPISITLTGEVTDHPVDDPPPSGSGATTGPVATLRKVDGTEATARVFETAFFRVREVFGVLQNLSLMQQTITYESELSFYDNLEVESAQLTRESGLAATLMCEIVLREVRVAETDSVQPEAREPRGRREQPRGAQETEEPANNTSLLQQGIDALPDALEGLGSFF